MLRIEAFDIVARELGRYLVAWKSPEDEHGQIYMCNSFEDAEDFLVHLPPAMYMDYKFIAMPEEM